ncbi:MAG: hypothetical protein EOP83_05385 [Verrucomicrobiaceae bacterium]|nr:MAG: hypothetical protein EOP83_05385 [Verrucomicrobiaceae bacterium]
MTKKAEAKAVWAATNQFLGDGPDQGVQLSTVEAKVLQQFLSKSAVGGAETHPYLQRPAMAVYDGVSGRWTVIVDVADQANRWATRFSAINPPWGTQIPRHSNVVDFWGNLDVFKRDLVLARTLHLPTLAQVEEEPA